MKKKLSLIAYCFALGLYAQNTSISGNVKSKKSLKPLSDVTIICKSSNNTFIKGEFSDNEGKFSFKNLPKQKIKLVFKFLGFKEKIIALDLSKQTNIDLSIIYLEENTTLIETVKVETEVPVIVDKIDRKVYNIENDLQALGANSLEVLQNIPSVNVDTANGSISLRGNKAKILINGKSSSQNIKNTLETLPRSSIKSIEVITNPSAKFTAEGMSGVINIVLKKNTKEGFNGNVRTGIKHSLNTQFETGVVLNFRKGKVNVFGEYSYDNGKRNLFYDINRLDKNLIQDIDFLNTDESNYFKIGADIYLNKKNTLSFYTTESFSANDLLTETVVVENTVNNFEAKSFSEYDYSDRNYNIEYTLNLNEKGETFEVEFNYNKMKEPEVNNTSEKNNPSYKNNNYKALIDDKSYQWLANIDYVKPIKNGNFELGVAYRSQNYKNDINTTQEYISNVAPLTFLPVGNTSLNYDRTIFSAYANATKEIKKWSFQLGLRLEDYNLNATFVNTEQGKSVVKDDLLSLFPTAYINYNLNDTNIFKLSYGRRIDRPSIDQITPIQEWNSPLSVSLGNVNLVPQITNGLEFDYTKKLAKSYLTLGLYYKETQDYVDSVIFNDSQNPDRQVFSYKNYDTARSFGFETSGRIKLIKWWNLYPSFELYYTNFTTNIEKEPVEVTNVVSKARLSNSIRINKKLSINVSGVFNGSRETIQYKVTPFEYFNFSARLKIFKNKGRFTFRLTDIFNTYNYQFSTQRGNDQKASYELELNAFSFNFSYRFGSGKNKPKQRRYRETNEIEKTLF